jgi:non-ribosomal peptide synthetase-like protein
MKVLGFTLFERQSLADGTAPRLLHEYFERQATMRPDHPAVQCNGQVFSYKQLDVLSNRIANWLRAHRIRAGSMVAICSEKSCELYAAIIGVLKAGAAYVPIDPKFPAERIRSIVRDAGVKVVISAGTFGRNLQLDGSIAVLLLDRNAGAIGRRSSRRPRPRASGVTAHDACYVIYTSGSTGRPKGVVIEHRNAVNFIRALRTVYKLGESDRVYQGFSLAFDASIEEIWAAMSLGGTLMVPPEDVARSPADTAEFINRESITFFSTVPTFLALIEHDLPSVRLLVTGGEQCSSELVARWARGRRMLNTYGPTEATVVATAAECIPGQSVTIGKALPGYTTYVLNERYEPVAPGEVGELFIGGESIARGYLNQPALSSERFVALNLGSANSEARLFRTHDLVQATEDGQLQYVGRNDELVKIRGFRVELCEIEAILVEHPGVRAAAVAALRHGQMTELAAFVVTAGDLNQDERQQIVALLHERLPDYMVPRYLDAIDELPTMVSGKVDRKRLPPPRTLLTSKERECVPAVTAIERTIVEVFESCFAVSPIFASDDFFQDLRGHSHIAARVVTELRARFDTTHICVRDIYTHRTASQLASHLEAVGAAQICPGAQSEAKKRCDDFNAQPVGTIGRWGCAFGQAIVVLLFYAIITAPVLFFVCTSVDVLNGRVEWWRAAENASTFALFIWPTWLLLSIVVKWLVIGRYKPGRYRVWGLYYLRWWIVSRMQSLSWSSMFVGTPLMSIYYRAMGARVGSSCTICSPFCGAFDLVSIGKGTSIGADTQLLGYRVEDGWLILGRIEIGEDCFIGMHCNLGLDVGMRERACLDDMSMLPDATVIAADESRRGSPARVASVSLPGFIARTERRWRTFLFGLVHLGLIYVMGYLLVFAALPGVGFVFYTYTTGGPAYAAASTFVAVPLSALCWIATVLAVKRFAIGTVTPGVYRLASGAYLRIWFLNYLLDNTRHLVLPVYATMLTPKLLKLLGAKIGKGVEISTVMHVQPDLLELGHGSFLADACIVGGVRIYRGQLEIMPNLIGNRTFVGNSALVPGGTDLGDNSLIGVLSAPPSDQKCLRNGTRWLGSPSFELPHTQPADAIDERRTYAPHPGWVILRGAMEMLRMLLPAFIVAGELVAFVYVLTVCYPALSPPALLLIMASVSLILSLTTVLAAASVKWTFIGNFYPTVRPLWCPYVWANEIVNGVYESLAANAMSPLLGTPFIAPCLRLMGCKIGKWVFLETTLFSEFDLVRIGDHAALNLGTTVQTHLFEDRIMKADALEIGDYCSLGNMSVILYGARMERGAKLGPMSLLMKGESLPQSSRWHGIPTEQIEDSAETSSDVAKAA